MRGREALVYAGLVASVVALVLSLIAYAQRPGPQAAPAQPPTVVRLPMVVATFTGQGMAAHRWYPTMLVVRRGDTVDLAIANPDRVSHQFELTGYNLRSKVLAPGSSDRLRFVADQPGAFPFRCMLPYDPAKGHCTPDHEQMLGYLIVTD